MFNIILASKSYIRAELLKQAGVTFDIIPAKIDERQIETKHLSNTSNPNNSLAQILAIEKAQHISAHYKDTLVIGVDQTLRLEHNYLHKSNSKEEAIQKLKTLRAKTHTLESGLACVQNGEVKMLITDQAHLTMRNFSDDFLERYVTNHLDDILSSVGHYHLEGFGIQLFEKIEGNYHTILGLPLLPLLNFLRAENLLQQ